MKKLLLIAALVIATATAEELPVLSDKTLNETLVKRGAGEFRRFGVHVYDAQLWTTDDSNLPPYALQLTYLMDIKSKRIVDASLKEMRQLGASKDQLNYWKKPLAASIPNVKDGDTITGVNLGNRANFYLNGKKISTMTDPQLVRMFFGIWLDKSTSEPKLRRQLLQQP